MTGTEARAEVTRRSPKAASPKEQARYHAFRAALRLGQWGALPTAGLRSVPDFLVIGGQRCGTTSLYRYLAQHPGVLFPRLTKGTHYFDEEYHRSAAWYRSNFPLDVVRRRTARRLGHPVVVGEACPYYLYHPAIPARIEAMAPTARLIAILRDPVERAWSGYRHEHKRGFEPLSFEEAIAAEPGRLAGAERLLAEPGARHFSHQHHGHVARGRYAEQLQRLWAAVDRDRTLVLYSDDLERDTANTLDRVYAFLGVPTHPTEVGKRWNEQKASKIPDDLRVQLAAQFEESDRWLADNLDTPPPWRT